MSGGNTVPSITQGEHIGPDSTGDNIQAKRVANYGWDGGAWQRMAPGLPQWDDLEVTPGSATDTYTFNRSGNVVATLTITYTDSTKAALQSIART